MRKQIKAYTFLFLASFSMFINKVGADGITNPRTKVSDISGDCGIIGGEVLEFLNMLWGYIVIFGPVIFIIMTLVDILKAISGSDDAAFKQVFSRAVKRLIAVIVLILLPVILNWILGFINDSFSTCVAE